MWICQNNSFLSIVNSDRDLPVLMVRARRKGDLEAAFGQDVEVTTLPGRDYSFRAFISRESSVKSSRRRWSISITATSRAARRIATCTTPTCGVWRVMEDLQEKLPRTATSAPGFPQAAAALMWE